MPKLNSEFPINLRMRVSIAQREHLDAMCSLHEVTPSEYLRALIDNDRADHAIRTIDGIIGKVK